MVSGSWALPCIGILVAAIGGLGLTGRLARSPSTSYSANYSSQVFLGLGAAGAGLVARLQEGPALIAVPLTVSTVALIGIGLWSVFAGPPRWSVPEWQRRLDATHREARQ